MITVKAIKCLQCNDIIYSRATHDYRSCSCRGVAVDCGHHIQEVRTDNIMRIVGNNYKIIEINIDLPLDEAPKIFYDDWNKRTNIYGRITRE